MQNHAHFDVLWTGDGSPSLRGAFESMHHLGGAYAETQYIYGEALRRLGAGCEARRNETGNESKNGNGYGNSNNNGNSNERYEDGSNRDARDKKLSDQESANQVKPEIEEVKIGNPIKDWKVLVVGLGLGYIELLALAEALKNKKNLQLLTYEIERSLVELFISWIKGQNENLVYDRMLDFFKKDYPEWDLKAELKKLYEQGAWKIEGAINKNSLPSESYQAILFDAFSGKTTPDLWTEEFLQLFLTQTASTNPCIFSTYACTGVLKRTLARAGFTVEKRMGFFGKRNATLGVKGI